MPMHQLLRSWQRGNESISQAETITADAELCLDFEIPAGQTVAARVGLWRDELVSLYLSASRPVAVSARKGETEQAALKLLEGVPLIWSKASGFAPPIAGDVDQFRFDNRGPDAALVRLRVLRNAPALEVIPSAPAPAVAIHDDAA
jgi:hypothetical protein